MLLYMTLNWQFSDKKLLPSRLFKHVISGNGPCLLLLDLGLASAMHSVLLPGNRHISAQVAGHMLNI